MAEYKKYSPRGAQPMMRRLVAASPYVVAFAAFVPTFGDVGTLTLGVEGALFGGTIAALRAVSAGSKLTAGVFGEKFIPETEDNPLKILKPTKGRFDAALTASVMLGSSLLVTLSEGAINASSVVPLAVGVVTSVVIFKGVQDGSRRTIFDKVIDEDGVSVWIGEAARSAEYRKEAEIKDPRPVQEADLATVMSARAKTPGVTTQAPIVEAPSVETRDVVAEGPMTAEEIEDHDPKASSSAPSF